METFAKSPRPPTGKPGAPQQYDRQAVTQAICTRLATGKEPMTVICADIGVPVKTVNDWRLVDEGIRAQFDEARDLGYDAIAMDCLRIADDVSEDPASRRVRIDTRLKLLARWDPRRYGDALKLSGDPERPLSGLSEAQIDERLAALLSKHQAAQ